MINNVRWFGSKRLRYSPRDRRVFILFWLFWFFLSIISWNSVSEGKSNKDFEAEFLDESIKKNSYYVAAKINLKLGDYDLAKELFLNSLALDKDFLKTNVNKYFLNDRELTKYLGLTFYLSGEYEDALTEFLKVREMEIEHIKNYPDHKHGAVLLRPGRIDHLIRLITMFLYIGLDNTLRRYKKTPWKSRKTTYNRRLVHIWIWW